MNKLSTIQKILAYFALADDIGLAIPEKHVHVIATIIGAVLADLESQLGGAPPAIPPALAPVPGTPVVDIPVPAAGKPDANMETAAKPVWPAMPPKPKLTSS
jgi:hypothetical protein